jgi:hypothetical protein
MIDFEKILIQQGVKKQDFASVLQIEPQNVNRTFVRLNKNLSEIEKILNELNTSLKSEISGNGNCDLSDRLLSIIESQQRTIEEMAKKGGASMEGKSVAAI